MARFTDPKYVELMLWLISVVMMGLKLAFQSTSRAMARAHEFSYPKGIADGGMRPLFEQVSLAVAFVIRVYLTPVLGNPAVLSSLGFSTLFRRHVFVPFTLCFKVSFAVVRAPFTHVLVVIPHGGILP